MYVGMNCFYPTKMKTYDNNTMEKMGETFRKHANQLHVSVEHSNLLVLEVRIVVAPDSEMQYINYDQCPAK